MKRLIAEAASRIRRAWRALTRPTSAMTLDLMALKTNPVWIDAGFGISTARFRLVDLRLTTTVGLQEPRRTRIELEMEDAGDELTISFDRNNRGSEDE